MCRISLIVLLFSVVNIAAQDAIVIQKEIDKNLWKPFKEAFENIDGEKLNALYAGEVIRVTPNGIDTENKFKIANLKRFEENKENSTTIQLNFWFDSRHTNETTSYEVGFYKLDFVTKEEAITIYGQFHIVLHKIDGLWKITQDWDTTKINGSSITAIDFNKQTPLEFK